MSDQGRVALVWFSYLAPHHQSESANAPHAEDKTDDQHIHSPSICLELYFFISHLGP
jgi:hypothetical protein